MEIIRTYGNIIKKYAPDHPLAAFRMIKAGLALEHFAAGTLLIRNLPGAYQYLNTYAVGEVLEALKHPETSVWANIFAPVELLQCFGLHSLSIECLSSFLSGFTIEDYFLDYAENEGLASTLCSYHKNFIGAIDSALSRRRPLRSPRQPSVTETSTRSDICLKKHHVPSFLLDIPQCDTPNAAAYVTGQLKELVSMLEDTFHKKFQPEELTAVLQRENESKACYERFLKHMQTHHYPSTLTLQMYMLFASHMNIGTPEILHFYQQMEAEAAAAPEFHGTNILWVHLLPYYQETLRKYFNLSDNYQIQAIEMNLDYRTPLNTEHPLDALAEKMVQNIYNGPYERKAKLVSELAQDLHS